MGVRMVEARGPVHVGGIGACARGAWLPADDPLVVARPAMFIPVPDQPEPVLDPEPDEEGDD